MINKIANNSYHFLRWTEISFQFFIFFVQFFFLLEIRTSNRISKLTRNMWTKKEIERWRDKKHTAFQVCICWQVSSMWPLYIWNCVSARLLKKKFVCVVAWIEGQWIRSSSKKRKKNTQSDRQRETENILLQTQSRWWTSTHTLEATYDCRLPTI